MMGRATLREVREALAAARSGEAKPPSATPTADELASLAHLLKGDASETAAAPPTAGAAAEVQPEGPRQSFQQTGGALLLCPIHCFRCFRHQM